MLITAWDDFKAGALRYELWYALAITDIVLRFRASVLGPFWLTLNTLIFALTLGFIFSTVFKIELEDYLPYLSTGLMIWTLMSSLVLEATNLFKINGAFVRNVKLPISTYIFQVLMKNLIIVLFHLPVTLIVLAYFGKFTQINGFTLLLNYCILIFIMMNVTIIISLIAARFVDVEPIIQAVLQVIFLGTPIIWSVEAMTERAHFVDFNPVYHLVEAVRAPLLGQPIADITWIALATIMVGTSILAAAIYTKFYHRIAYWVQ